MVLGESSQRTKQVVRLFPEGKKVVARLRMLHQKNVVQNDLKVGIVDVEKLVVVRGGMRYGIHHWVAEKGNLAGRQRIVVVQEVRT